MSYVFLYLTCYLVCFFLFKTIISEGNNIQLSFSIKYE